MTTPNKKFIRPSRAGLKVRYEAPSNRFLAPDGAWVVWSPWWSGKAKEGDVVEVPAPVPQSNEVTPQEEV